MYGRPKRLTHMTKTDWLANAAFCNSGVNADIHNMI